MMLFTTNIPLLSYSKSRHVEFLSFMNFANYFFFYDGKFSMLEMQENMFTLLFNYQIKYKPNWLYLCDNIEIIIQSNPGYSTTLYFENPALFEVDRRSRFYFYINQCQYKFIIRNALSEYLPIFRSKISVQFYNHKRIEWIIRSQTNCHRSTRWPVDLWKNINSHACI
jgi:hypothetical protein